jgi:hypothetical protein
MKITVSRLKELINEELNTFSEEQEELEEGSGDRNDPDREQGHGPQRQRASSAGADGEYLEEGEEELEEQEALEEAGRMMADKQRGAEDPTRLRLEKYVAAMVDNSMGFEVIEEAAEPTLEEQIGGIVDTYMNIVMEALPGHKTVQDAGEAPVPAEEKEEREEIAKREKEKEGTQPSWKKAKEKDPAKNEAMKDGLEKSLEEVEEPALEVNETLAGWYNKKLFESLTKKWSK